jgi:hypothetical protein
MKMSSKYIVYGTREQAVECGFEIASLIRSGSVFDAGVRPEAAAGAATIVTYGLRAGIGAPGEKPVMAEIGVPFSGDVDVEELTDDQKAAALEHACYALQHHGNQVTSTVCQGIPVGVILFKIALWLLGKAIL